MMFLFKYYDFLINFLKYLLFEYYFFFILAYLSLIFFYNLIGLSFFSYEKNFILKNNRFIVDFYLYFLKLCLLFSVLLFCYHVCLFLCVDFNTKPFQAYFLYTYHNIAFNFSLDNISLLFLLLTSFILVICILIFFCIPLSTIIIETNNKNYLFNFMTTNDKAFLQTYHYNLTLIFFKKAYIYLNILILLKFVLICFFTTCNILVLYVMLELSMLPLFFIITLYGSRANRLKAAYYIFFYTVVGSIPFLIGTLCLYLLTGSLNLFTLYCYNFDVEIQKILFILFFVPLALKIPIVPLHIWLPEAHVEAPTEGSILLAGLLLKLSIFALIRFILPLFPAGSLYFSSFIYTLSTISILYTSMLVFCQIDMKKIIAYSSIAHMNYALLGIFSFLPEGLQGGIYICYTHGIISSALFACIGCLYSRFYTRILSYYGGLAYYFPILSTFFFLFILGNISFPGTGGFVGELLVLLGLISDSIFIGFLSIFGSFICTAYSIFLYTRICFGMPFAFNSDLLHKSNNMFLYNKSLTLEFEFKMLLFKPDFLNSVIANSIKMKIFLLEYLIFFFLAILMFYSGIYPNLYLNLLSNVFIF